MHLGLRENQLAVGNDVELSGAAGRDFGILAEARFQ
jgi:hypothetical protein